MRTTGLLVAIVLAAVVVSSTSVRSAAADPPPPTPDITSSVTPVPAGPLRSDSPVWVFAAVEDAWMAGDTDRLAALVDTATVRVALKPGTPPTSAMTRSAVAFLFRDQLRLVKTTSFQIVKLDVKKGRAQALALWSGDWGGRQGAREVEVGMVAVLHGNRWELSEVRAND
jgi:hypothetical protein